MSTEMDRDKVQALAAGAMMMSGTAIAAATMCFAAATEILVADVGPDGAVEVLKTMVLASEYGLHEVRGGAIQ